MDKNDPKFVSFVDRVSPNLSIANQVLYSIDWNTVLAILLEIFKIILASGCLAARRTTRDVKAAMALTDIREKEAGLNAILIPLKNTKGKK